MPRPDLSALQLSNWGVEAGYEDDRGQWHRASPDTLAAIAELMGATAGGPPGTGDQSPVRVVTAGRRQDMDGPWELVQEDGTVRTGSGPLPHDLPLGYHDLDAGQGQPVRLIVSPGRCHLPAGLATWGFAVQLYALRSAASWGIGDLADLRDLGRWSAGLGAGMALVNPLHAARPQEPSPYFPSSRCWRNPIYLRVEDLPGMAGWAALDEVAAAGRALSQRGQIDRDAVWSLKRQALEWAWERFEDDGHFENWTQHAGPSLATYATFATLGELHQGPWPGWPPGVRHPGGAGIGEVARAHAGRIRFHQWLQWLLDVQLARAGQELGLVSDLAIGVDPDGADAWQWQDCLALEATVGAPPDAFNTRGQDWGLPPLDPWRLRLAKFEPFIQTIRAGMAHAGGLRFDHVIGLFRLWWVPPGAAAADGAYVRYPWSELLDILALESVRAGAYVVGEDLGTMEPRVRSELADRGVLSYRLMWFEPEPPRRWPAQSLGAVSTHDLPTVAGLWTGADLAAQDRLGMAPDVEANDEIRRRVLAWLGLGPAAGLDEVRVAIHRLLARSPSAVLAATLDDVLGVVERPNLPGTTSAQRPNWCLALPSTLEEIMADPVVAEVARALRRQGPAGPCR